MSYSASLETMDTPNTDHVYEHPEYNAPVQPKLDSNFNQLVQPQSASNFNQSNFNQLVQPQSASNFNQSNFNQPVQPQTASNFNQSNFHQPVQPQTASNFNQSTFNQPVQPQDASNFNQSTFNQPVQPQTASNFNQSTFNQPVQPQDASNFNQSTFNQPVQPQNASNFNQDHQPQHPQWANSFNQPSQLQGAISYPPGNVQCVPDNNVVRTTGPMFIMPPFQGQIRDYQVYSIFTMVLCCFPIGLAAFIFSRKTKEAIRNNNAAQAREYSSKALIFNNVALVLGIIIAIAYISGVIYYIISRQIIYSHTSSSYYNQCYSYVYHSYYYC